MTVVRLTCIMLLVVLTCCSPRINIRKTTAKSPGLNGITFEKKGSYPEFVIKYFLKKLKTPDRIDIFSGIDVYRVTYFTRDEKDKRTLVSGLLAIPRDRKIKGIVSYQHGTNSERSQAPSLPTKDEGLGIAAIFAGGGYLCVIPDYLGMGLSTEVHTYLHVPSTVSAVVDLLKIGSEICTSLTGKRETNLYLVGISQGGHATAAVHRHLEKYPVEGLRLTATSSIVGAYNLKDISIPYAIKNNSVFYLGYLANAYCHIYEKSLNSIVSGSYDTVVPRLFNGNYSYNQIKARLPKTADSLFTKEVLSDIRTGKPDWFTDKLAENQTFDWKPEVRFRMYFGSGDKDVSPEEAQETYKHMLQLGGNVQLVGLGNLNHLASAYAALPKTRAYFDSISVIQKIGSDR